MNFPCPHCGVELKAGELDINNDAICPKCKSIITVSSPAGASYDIRYTSGRAVASFVFGICALFLVVPTVVIYLNAFSFERTLYLFATYTLAGLSFICILLSVVYSVSAFREIKKSKHEQAGTHTANWGIFISIIVLCILTYFFGRDEIMQMITWVVNLFKK